METHAPIKTMESESLNHKLNSSIAKLKAFFNQQRPKQKEKNFLYGTIQEERRKTQQGIEREMVTSAGWECCGS